jgi:hypothetical protein
MSTQDSSFIQSEIPVENDPKNDHNFPEEIIEENKLKLTLLPSKRKKTKKVNMIIEGEFTVGSASLVLSTYDRLKQHFDLIKISLRNIVNIDLAAIQLMHVIRSSNTSSEKSIFIDSELSKEDRALLGYAGLTDVLVKQ